MLSADMQAGLRHPLLDANILSMCAEFLPAFTASGPDSGCPAVFAWGMVCKIWLAAGTAAMKRSLPPLWQGDLAVLDPSRLSTLIHACWDPEGRLGRPAAGAELEVRAKARARIQACLAALHPQLEGREGAEGEDTARQREHSLGEDFVVRCRFGLQLYVEQLWGHPAAGWDSTMGTEDVRLLASIVRPRMLLRAVFS